MFDSNIYVPFFKFYFIFYSIFALSFQFFLFLLILKKSPPHLSSLKIFLYNTLATQVLLICSTFNIQPRVLPGKTSLAILSAGPCNLINSVFCFISYHFHMAITEVVGFSIAITVFFRYLIMIKNDLSTRNIYSIILLSYIGPIIAMIIPYTSEWDFERVQNMTQNEHPTYNLSIYGDYPGFYDIGTFQFVSSTFILAAGVYLAPTSSIFFAFQVLRLINRNMTMSTKTKIQSKTLIHGLFFQTIIPLICYIPMFSCYLFTQITGDENILSEHLFLVSSCSPGLFDPLISFYFIVPYRMAIKQLFQRKNVQSTRVFTLTNTSTVS